MVPASQSAVAGGGEARRGPAGLSSRDGSQIGPIVRPARPLHVSKPIVVVDFYSYYTTHNSDVLISFNRAGMPKRASSWPVA